MPIHPANIEIKIATWLERKIPFELFSNMLNNGVLGFYIIISILQETFMIIFVFFVLFGMVFLELEKGVSNESSNFFIFFPNVMKKIIVKN